MDEYCPVLVLDNGSGTCKAGFSGDGNNLHPNIIFYHQYLLFTLSNVLTQYIRFSPSHISKQYQYSVFSNYSFDFLTSICYYTSNVSYLYDFNSSLFFQMHPVPCFLQLLVVPPHQCDDGHGTEGLLWVMRSRPGETLSTSPILSSMASSPTGMTWRRSGTTLSTMVCPLYCLYPVSASSFVPN